MPLATATVSGVSIQVGTSLPRPGVVTATLADPYISDDAANAIYSGVDAETVAADGTFSLTLPAGYVYTFRFAPDDADPGWTIGPALVTVDTGIDDLVTVTAAGVDSVNIGTIDHGNQSGTLTLAATIGLQEVTLTGDLAVTPTGPVGTSVMLAAHQDGTGGHALTFTDATLTVDGWTMPTTGFALIVFNHLYSGWLASPAGVTLAAGDTTAPTAGTLAASAITSDGFTLTVTGAADETALAALPYRFSTDNGTTWSAWRSTPYVATGLAASTAYTCQHQTRDATGNTSPGTSITVTTSAGAATWQLWDEWNFAAKADGTLVTSIAGTNGHTLTSTSSGGTAATVQGGKIKCNATDGNISYSVAGWSTSIPHRLSIDYDVTDAPGGHTPSLGHYTLGGSYGLTTSYIRGGTTPLSLGPTYADGGSVPAVVWDNGKSATDIPTSGTMTTTIDPVARTIAVSYNGVQYAHRDLSTWTYGGGSVLPMAFNGCWFRLFDLAPAASKFKVEVFQ